MIKIILDRGLLKFSGMDGNSFLKSINFNRNQVYSRKRFTYLISIAELFEALGHVVGHVRRHQHLQPRSMSSIRILGIDKDSRDGR